MKKESGLGAPAGDQVSRDEAGARCDAERLVGLRANLLVDGSRLATSWRPTAADCRVAATMLARSSSYQASAASMLANVNGG